MGEDNDNDAMDTCLSSAGIKRHPIQNSTTKVCCTLTLNFGEGSWKTDDWRHDGS